MRGLLLSIAVFPPAMWMVPTLANEPAPAPRLSYGADMPRDDEVSFGGTPEDYRGRWTGTWQGEDGRTYSGTYEGSFAGSGQGQESGIDNAPLSRWQGGYEWQPQSAPDPAHIGSGTIVNGWYYPPPVTVTTVIENGPAGRK